MDYVENYEDLGNAIILQAFDDYCSWLYFYKKFPSSNTKRELNKIEYFFHSALYEVCTKIPPSVLIKLAERKVDERIRIEKSNKKSNTTGEYAN